MLRCRQTADFLYPNAMLTVVEDLREWNFGDFEGKTMEELKDDPDYLDWIASSMKSTPPGGESSKEFARPAAAGHRRHLPGHDGSGDHQRRPLSPTAG